MSALAILKDALTETLAEIANLEKYNEAGRGNKASEARIRKHTHNLTKVGKDYRKESVRKPE